MIRLIVILTVTLLLIACNSSRVVTDPNQVDRPVPPPLQATQPAPVQGPAVERHRVSDSAPWLAELMPARFRGDTNASSALYVLAPAVRFDFDLGRDDPLVNLMQESAQTRQDYIDTVCTLADWEWSIRHGVLVVSNTITRTFAIHAPPGQAVNRISPGSLSGEQLGTEATSATYVADAYKDLSSGLQLLLSEEVEQKVETIDPDLNKEFSYRIQSRNVRIILLAASGQIMALAPPSIMRQIENLVADYNRRINRRVALEFVLYEVDVTDTRTRSLDLNLLREAAIAAGVNLTAPSANVTGTGELKLNFNEGNTIDGSSLILRWLNSQGNTTVSIRKKVFALHNQVTSLRDIQTTRYIARIAIERQLSGLNETVSPTVDAGELFTGETWAVLPTIAADRVYLRLAVSRAALLGFTDYAFGGDAISGSLPQSASRTVGLPISLADGETRLITNLSSTTINEQKSESPLLSWLPWLGSTRDDQARRIESVISMTARIIED